MPIEERDAFDGFRSVNGIGDDVACKDTANVDDRLSASSKNGHAPLHMFNIASTELAPSRSQPSILKSAAE